MHFENFEGLAGRSRGDDGGSDVEGRIINHLKVQLDGVVRNDGVFIFAETNRPDLLDKVITKFILLVLQLIHYIPEQK